MRWGRKEHEHTAVQGGNCRDFGIRGGRFDSWLCHVLELCGIGQIISILSLICAIFFLVMNIFILTL